MSLGIVLVCLHQEQSLVRVCRVLTVAGSFLVAAMLMQVDTARRDYLLLPAVSMITGCGIIFLWRLNPELASRQVVWVLMGAALMVITYYLLDDVRDLARYKYTAGVGAVVLMAATMIWGQEKGGARLWLEIPGIMSFQPGEFAKVLVCVFLAGYVAEKGEIIRSYSRDPSFGASLALRHMGPLLLLVVFSLAIFVLLRDLGAAMLFFGLFVAVSYLATNRKRYAALMTVLFAAGAVGAYYYFPHVGRRMEAWLHPYADPYGAGHQILQALFGLAAGGLSGVGFGMGFPDNLPAAETDMILAVIGEEAGLLGSVGLMLLFVAVCYRTFAIGWQSRDSFGALLATTLGLVFALQTLVIAGGILRLIPLTGITLPFVSYGGSSIVVNFIALSLVLAVSRDCILKPRDG
jgi:cell division protein FtsW (lipid II flippase)